MRASSVFMLVLAILFGSGAVFVTKLWLDSQRASMVGSAEANLNPTATIVVASSSLRFGDSLTPDNLREIAWPGSDVPEGAFSRIDEVLKEGGRQALQPLERNEPVLKWKITGPGQRASLSAVVDAGKKAVTIRVNDILGVAGFVLPGDRVDIMLTRGGRRGGDSYTDVLLQGVKVLAIDQIADERRDDPKVSKAVTVEVDTEQAQKLTLAANVGQLSLALRNIAQGTREKTRRISLGDLSVGEIALPPPAPEAPAVDKPRGPVMPRVGVVRGTSRTEYEVRGTN